MRLFVAVNFPAPVRQALARLAAELATASLPVRWTPEENLHLTLRWLGEKGPHERDLAGSILRKVAAQAEPFEAGFGPVGAFPSPRRPRVIWIGVEGGPRLRLLRDLLERHLAAEGFERDARSFRPHVTLGRARRDAPPGVFRRFAALSGSATTEASSAVDAIDLMRSHLGPDGARYERVVTARLGGEPLPAGDSRA